MTSTINPEKKFIFVHVHKCAGSAITKALLGEKSRENKDWDSPRDSLERSKKIMIENNKLLGSQFSAPDHFRALDMKEFLGADIYDSYYKFAVSRNPWDRLASWYFFLRQYQNKGQSEIALQLTMEDFIKYSIDEFYLPQSHWVTDADGKVIVDEIVKLDDLQAKWPSISSKVSDAPIELRSVNRSINTTEPRPNPFSHVKTETLEKFVKAYEQDFELLGYSKDLPEHRSDNTMLLNCEKIWQAELKGERDIDDRCQKLSVPVDFYAMYREANSSHFYTGFLNAKFLNSGEKQLVSLKEKLANSQASNQELRQKFKVDFDKMQTKLKMAKEEQSKQRKSHAAAIKKLGSNQDRDADKARLSKLTEDLAAEKKSNLELRKKFKVDFDKMQTKFKMAKEDQAKQRKAHAAEIKKFGANQERVAKLNEELVAAKHINLELRQKFKENSDARNQKIQDLLAKIADLSK